MEFWDREREIEYLKRYLQTEPNAILFVYGPKSSGKSTLLMKVAQELKKHPIKFLWYDLRGYAIEKMEDAISILLGGKGFSEAFTKLFDINLFVVSIKTQELMKIFRKEKDPFVVMENELVKLKENGITPVIVFDEIQNFRDIYLNGDRRLIDRLFNFFVTVTKVKHVTHVLVMTSDTFLIEEVYTSSALKNTSEFYLVDYFDDETAKEILVESGKLSEKEAEYVISWIGGVPWMIERVISNGDPFAKVNEMYRVHKSRLKEVFGKLYEEDEKLRDECKELLKRFLEGEEIEIEGKDRVCVKKLVEMEVFYYDPVEGELRFQTRLDEKAAKELIGWSSGTRGEN